MRPGGVDAVHGSDGRVPSGLSTRGKTNHVSYFRVSVVVCVCTEYPMLLGGEVVDCVHARLGHGGKQVAQEGEVEAALGL